jgi:hypothetical protein
LGRRGRLAAVLRAAHRLPTWAPAVSTRHTLSPRLPHGGQLAALLTALHGRIVVVNQPPSALVPADTAALVRGLVGTVLFGLPASPWPAAARGASAHWPASSQTAHEQVLAHGWYTRQGAARRAPAPAVAVVLCEGPARVSLHVGGGSGDQHGPDVRAAFTVQRAARSLRIPQIVVTSAYQLVVVSAPASGPAAAPDVCALAAGPPPANGEAVLWCARTVLAPDAAVVDGMDAPSRAAWASLTGRAGAPDAYWHPASWARFLDGGRGVGHVSAADVGRSMPSGPPTGAASDAFAASRPSFSARIERGVPVPPGYALVDCVGTLGVVVAHAAA